MVIYTCPIELVILWIDYVADDFDYICITKGIWISSCHIDDIMGIIIQPTRNIW